MKAVTDSIHNFFTSALSYPFIILSSIVVTRLLGPEGKGLYVYLIMTANVILPIAFLGLGNGIQYYLSNQTYRFREVSLSSIFVGLSTGAVVAMLIFTLWSLQWFGASGNQVPLTILLCFLLALPFDGMRYVIRFLLTGSSAFKTNNYFLLLNSFLSALFLLIFTFTFNYKLLGAAIAFNSVRIFIGIYLLFHTFRKFGMALSIDWQYLRRVYTYGIKSWLGNISARANDRLDQLIIGAFVNPAQLGIYSVSYALFRFIFMPSNAIAPVLFNEISRENDLKKSILKAAKVHRSLFIFIALLACLLGISAHWLIPLLYGEAFREAYVPFLILLPGIVVYAVSRRVLQKVLAANGYPLKTSQVQFIGAIVGLGAYLLLIPPFGIIGAAIGSTMAYFVSTIVAYVLAYRLNQGHFQFYALSMEDARWMKRKLMNVWKKRKG